MKVFEIFGHLNYLAIIVGSIAHMVLGALWYSPVLFGKTWAKETGRDMSKPPENMGMMYGLTFAATFVRVLLLAVVLGPSLVIFGMEGDSVIVVAIVVSLLIGLGISATTTVINGLFQGKSTTLMLIDIGYSVTGILIAGIILSAWG